MESKINERAKELGISGTISKSNKEGKKWMLAVSPDVHRINDSRVSLRPRRPTDGVKQKYIHFGADDYDDYTMHQDEERRKSFHQRFKKNKNYNVPYTPMWLSRMLLW
jgi:hypothetical protein